MIISVLFNELLDPLKSFVDGTLKPAFIFRSPADSLFELALNQSQDLVDLIAEVGRNDLPFDGVQQCLSERVYRKQPQLVRISDNSHPKPAIERCMQGLGDFLENTRCHKQNHRNEQNPYSDAMQPVPTMAQLSPIGR